MYSRVAALMRRGAAILGLSGPSLTAWERPFLADYQPFGVILFARNIETPEQIRTLTADVRGLLGPDVLVFVDQEGGRVQRLRGPYWREWNPPLQTVTAAGPHAARAMALRSTLISNELRALGINANCAPVADIAGAATHPFLQNRCYGQDAQTVTDIARAIADAHLTAGVLPVLKHIPGHGRSGADTHHDLPRVTAPIAELDATDFAPFRALNDLPMAMTAHIIFDAIDPVYPATHSPATIAMIRDQIGFDGLLMTDDLNMQALSGDMASRVSRSLRAGCDVVLQCNGDQHDMLAVATAAPQMSAAATARADAALARLSPAPELDIAQLWAEFSDILGADAHG